MSSVNLIVCPSCQTPWSLPETDAAFAYSCPGCLRQAIVATFPALTHPQATATLPEKLVVEGESSCFYHADKRAIVPCGACGRFLCALCDVLVGERHLCPGCIETGRAKGRFLEFETSRALWDSAALLLAVLPVILCFYICVFTAPAAIVVAVMGWKKPSSIIPRNRWRLWAALIIATLEIAGMIAGIVYLVVNGGFSFSKSFP